jgi:hypothetical protein
MLITGSHWLPLDQRSTFSLTSRPRRKERFLAGGRVRRRGEKVEDIVTIKRTG